MMTVRVDRFHPPPVAVPGRLLCLSLGQIPSTAA